MTLSRGSGSPLMAFERGFKTRCENVAATVRKELSQSNTAPLSVGDLASHLGVQLIEPRAIPGLSEGALAALLHTDADDWSALTIGEGSSGALIVYNPTHSLARQASDLAHEIAHLLLRHTPSTMMFSPDGSWTLRTFNSTQEDEANWLAGCLLLPRAALEFVVRQGSDDEAIAADYGVSLQMVRYRKGVTGVSRQYGRRVPTRR